MLTENFLYSLRQGDYSLILEWLDFLERHYCLHNENGSADTIIPLMVFELINHGFTSNDFATFQLLNAVVNCQGFALPGKIECGIMHMTSAVLQCMVYEEHKLIPFYQLSSKPDFVVILEWMERDNLLLSDEANSKALQKYVMLLEARSLDCQIKAEKIKNDVLMVVSWQNRCNDYLGLLHKVDPVDEKCFLRIGVVQSMGNYLLSQMLLTPQVMNTLTDLVEKVRELAPFDWEETYLSSFVAQSIGHWLRQESSRRWRFFSSEAFHYLIPLKTENHLQAAEDLEDVEMKTLACKT